jgi:hypothetical protein
MIFSPISLSFSFRSAAIMAILMHQKKCADLFEQSQAFSAPDKRKLSDV